jgi:hypothetical protein
LELVVPVLVTPVKNSKLKLFNTPAPNMLPNRVPVKTSVHVPIERPVGPTTAAVGENPYKEAKSVKDLVV